MTKRLPPLIAQTAPGRRARERAAAEIEYQSWLDELNTERIHHCPDGRLHDEAPVDPSTGYAFVCVLCGHHSFTF